jgi:xylulose-5-phosphate/fructose-6-phosphate phosphoketolase
VPVAEVRENAAHRHLLEAWMREYRPQELFDEGGRLRADLRALAPDGDKRMGASPYANGGYRPQALNRPDWRDFALPVPHPGGVQAEATRAAGAYLAEIFRRNADRRNFRLMGPDETSSNRLDAVFDVTTRAWMEPVEPYDEKLGPGGRVMEVLSEHMCQGWLEGYTLTGRHGLFNCYEAFIHIVDSMFNQHAKWLKVARQLEWRRPVPSLNYLLSSHVWRQDHNGFSHQDPGFLDLVVNKTADVVRVYLPPDANCLLRTLDHCLGTHDRINVIVAGKQPAPQWLTPDQAEIHCAAGASIWEWASNDCDGAEPDVVMACAGDVPTMETLAAVDLLRRHVPHLKIRVVNVVDLLTLQPRSEHPHGLEDAEFDALFTPDRPVIFAFHGYPWLIHRLAYRRTNHDNFHVRGFKDEGTTTTPFDMVVSNDLDRFHLALDVIERVPGLLATAAHAAQLFRDKLIEHKLYVRAHGEDMPEITGWCWPFDQPDQG